ncbi:MAG: ion transporter [Planctomycetota bacterium]|nr:ion transporter [Planctomycetota bacterium]
MPIDHPPEMKSDRAVPAMGPVEVGGWRQKFYEIIFEADTRPGKLFDVLLLIAILISVIALMLESVEAIEKQWGSWLRGIEWTITILFTIEYLFRILSVQRPLRYCTSFFGIVDLLAIVPTYLSVIVPGSHVLGVVRVLRLVRVFRIFNLGRYERESQVLLKALKATQAKITVFLLVIITLVLVLGALVYVIESPQPGSKFTSIPRSVYWAIVTVTTVGYGDMSPQTVSGQFLAAVAMILGYAIIIVPSGIFSAEIIMSRKTKETPQACPGCMLEGHEKDAKYCRSCGGQLE